MIRKPLVMLKILLSFLHFVVNWIFCDSFLLYENCDVFPTFVSAPCKIDHFAVSDGDRKTHYLSLLPSKLLLGLRQFLIWQGSSSNEKSEWGKLSKNKCITRFNVFRHMFGRFFVEAKFNLWTSCTYCKPFRLNISR